MKTLKTILISIVLGAIGVFIVLWLVGSWNKFTGKSNIKEENAWVHRIKTQIDSLRAFPKNRFSTAYYQDVKAELGDFHAQQDLAKQARENDSVYHELAQSLFGAYVLSLGREALFVFDGERVKNSDFQHIKKEVKAIEGNGYYADLRLRFNDTFAAVRDIVAHYPSVDKFIRKCQSFRYRDDGINARFPMDKMKEWGGKVEDLLTKDYVVGVRSFKDRLQQLPKSLFQKHVSYLRHKIKKQGGDYDRYYFQSTYIRYTLKPLEKDITDWTSTINSDSALLATKDELKELLRDMAFKSILAYAQKEDKGAKIPLLFNDKYATSYIRSKIKDELEDLYFWDNQEGLDEVLSHFSFPVLRYYHSTDVDKEFLRNRFKKTFTYDYHKNKIKALKCIKKETGQYLAIVLGLYSFKRESEDDKETLIFMDKVTLDKNYEIKSIYSIYKENIENYK